MSYNRVNGYAAECERTVFLGEPSSEEHRLYETVTEARSLAFGMVKPGTRCNDIDLATQDLGAFHEIYKIGMVPNFCDSFSRRKDSASARISFR